MFGLDLPQVLLLAVIGFICVGPERLPTFARDAGRLLRQLRQMADGASAELRASLPDAAQYGLDDVRSLRDLHPKNVLAKALFDDEDGPDLFGDRTPRPGTPGPAVGGGAHGAPAVAPAARTAVVRAPGSPPPYDLDAT